MHPHVSNFPSICWTFFWILVDVPAFLIAPIAVSVM